jgi:AAA+ ATPase superfamily predicted ATPase
MFVDRQEELSHLTRLEESGRPEFLILYGRRRTGKTALLRHFATGRDCLFFSADLSSERDQLAQLTESVFGLTQDAFLQTQPFGSWESALRYIFDHLPGRVPLVIIDEFPYLCASNRALPSILQKVWDQRPEGRRIVLVLCGSTISFMEKEVLGAKSPLYGRRTSQMDLRPFDFDALAEFFPGLPARDRVYAYAVLGGIPAYLERYDAGRTLEANILEGILDKHSPLYEEPRFLLMQELNEPSLYFSILKAVAFGRTRLNDIAQETGIVDRHKVNKYISVLRDLRIVKREVPVTEDKPYKSRKGIYLLSDNFFRFWFRYVYANLSSLDAAGARFVWEEKIKPDLESFTALAFEDICAQRLSKLNALGRLPFRAANLGRWWDGRNEIDIVALDGKGSVLFCECKWTARKVGINMLRELEGKAALFPETSSRYYGFFSKSGFTPEMEDLARSRGDILLFDWGPA